MTITRKHDPAITAFTQHGMIPEGTSGDQAYGVCPFCGKSKHFYVHKKTHMWDCKTCLKKGGYQTFLTTIAEHCNKEFKGDIAISLSKQRGIKLSTLRKAKIGWNASNSTFIIPVMDANKERMWDVRIYGKKGLKSTSGCKVGLYNWENLNLSVTDVWLCEGEWDSMVMNEVLTDLKLKDTIAVAVPGAGTFKAEWVTMFEGKNVYVPYDHDNAGFEGSRKVYNNLSQIAKKLRFVHWPKSSTKGWDLRDQYGKMKKKASKFYLYLEELLDEKPPGLDEDSSDSADFGSNVKVATTQLDGPGITCQEVYTRFQKWLKLPTTDVLDVMFGTVIANRLPGDPLWLFLVAPSGATKTELIMSMFSSPLMVTTTTLTGPALISGANVAGGNDPSLLRIMNERILLIKDFTTILSMNSLLREEIFGLLRDAYDGRIEKRFGNGVYRLYDPCRFGIVAGVTPAIELFTDEHTALGERFLRFKVPLVSDWTLQRDIIRKAVSNTTHEEEMRKDLQSIGHDVLNTEFADPPQIDDKIIEKVICLAQWTATLRSTIVRDKFSKEVTHKPFSELGTRLAKQFCKLLLGIGMFRGLKTVTEAEYLIVKSVALGTVPSRMEDIMKVLYSKDKTATWSAKEISDIINLPQSTTVRIIENLGMLNVLQKTYITQHKYNWSLTSEIIDLIERASIY